MHRPFPKHIIHKYTQAYDERPEKEDMKRWTFEETISDDDINVLVNDGFTIAHVDAEDLTAENYYEYNAPKTFIDVMTPIIDEELITLLLTNARKTCPDIAIITGQKIDEVMSHIQSRLNQFVKVKACIEQAKAACPEFGAKCLKLLSDCERELNRTIQSENLL